MKEWDLESLAKGQGTSWYKLRVLYTKTFSFSPPSPSAGAHFVFAKGVGLDVSVRLHRDDTKGNSGSKANLRLAGWNKEKVEMYEGYPGHCGILPLRLPLH